MDFKLADKKLKKYKSCTPLSKSYAEQLQADFYIRFTYNSTSIEGNTMTLEGTTLLLSEGITSAGKTLEEHIEIKNHAKAVLYVDNLLKDKVEMSEEIIKKIHKILYKDLGIDEDDNKFAGSYREENVIVKGANFFPTKYTHIENEMNNLISWYNNEKNNLHPIEKAAELHGRFVDIHPFVDGNGRTSRLLLNYELIKNGFPGIIIEKEEREIYFKCLNERRDGKSDFTDFVKMKVEKRLDFLIGLAE